MDDKNQNDEKSVKIEKTRKRIKITFFVFMVIVLAWFWFITYEYSLVRKDKRPILCWGAIEDLERENEKSIMCYGIGIKYKEYYYIDSGAMSAREMTLFFTDFDRNPE